MAKALVLTKKAQEDIDDAYRWYNKRQKGLGDEFVRCVDAKISSIARSPLHYQIILEKRVRRALINRFPYSIYFIDEEKHVIVIAILHQRQNYPTSPFDEPVGLN